MIVGLLWIVRILIILLILRIVLRWFAGRQVTSTAGPRIRRGERAGGQLLRDPQCGTYVAEGRAIRAAGQAFCSTECRDRWLAGSASAAAHSSR